MVVRCGNLPSETRAPYHKLDRSQQLFVDFRIDFINKMLIIGLTIEREPEESAMSELGIYEGCYVELRNGDVVGPLSQDVPYFRKIWKLQGQKRWWNSDGSPHGTTEEGVNIIRVMPKDAIKLTMSKTYGDFTKLGQATIPPHVTKAAMDAGIKADPAYEQFVNAILTAGFKAQYGIEFVPVTEQAPVSVTDELLEQMASVFGDKGFYELGDTAQQKLRGAAECAVAFFGGNQVVPKNESENRIPNSEKTKGGLSDLRSEVVKVLRDNDTIRGIGATADAIMKIVEGVQVGTQVIPSLREIHDEVLAEIRDWHAKYGRDSIPSSFSIAKAFHRMLTPVAVKKPVHLVAPEGWYLYECKHEHTAHRFAGQTVTPSDHPGGAWSVDFRRLVNGGMLTGGRGKTLVEAWQNAVAAIKLAEEHGLDI